MKHSDLQMLRELQTGERARVEISQVVNELLVKNSSSSRVRAANDLWALAAQLQAYAVSVNASAAANVAAAPTISSRTQATGVSTIVVNFTGADLGGFSLPAHWIISPARTVTRVRQTGIRQLSIDYSGAVLVAGDSPTIAFDNPVSPTLRSVYGVAVADAAASAVTVV